MLYIPIVRAHRVYTFCAFMRWPCSHYTSDNTNMQRFTILFAYNLVNSSVAKIAKDYTYLYEQ